MGVNIKSKNYETEVGYYGFFLLRLRVAECTAPILGKLYWDMCNFHYDKEIVKMCYELLEQFSKENKGKYDKILEFLCDMYDCQGKIGVRYCKAIYNVIKDYDDDIVYGYKGRKNPCKFADFKRIIKDGIDTKNGVSWH